MSVPPPSSIPCWRQNPLRACGITCCSAGHSRDWRSSGWRTISGVQVRGAARCPHRRRAVRSQRPAVAHARARSIIVQSQSGAPNAATRACALRTASRGVCAPLRARVYSSAMVSPTSNPWRGIGRSPRAKDRVARVVATRSGRKRWAKRGSASTDSRAASTKPLRTASSSSCSGAHRNFASSHAASLLLELTRIA